MESIYYEFELKLQRLYLDIDSSCEIAVWWKREKSKQKAISKRFLVDKKVQYIDLEDTLKTSVKCKFQEGRAAPFLTKIEVLIYPTNKTMNNSCKAGGAISDFDVTQILLPDNRKASVSKRFELKL